MAVPPITLGVSSSSSSQSTASAQQSISFNPTVNISSPESRLSAEGGRQTFRTRASGSSESSARARATSAPFDLGGGGGGNGPANPTASLLSTFIPRLGTGGGPVVEPDVLALQSEALGVEAGEQGAQVQGAGLGIPTPALLIIGGVILWLLIR